MTRKNVTIDDLTAAIEWMNSYEGSDDNDEMRDALEAVTAHLAREISARHASTLERTFKNDIKKQSKMLTEQGKAQLKILAKEKGDELANNILNEVRNNLAATI